MKMVSAEVLALIFAVLLPFLEQVDHVFPPPLLLLHNQFAIRTRAVQSLLAPGLSKYTHACTSIPNFNSSISFGDTGVKIILKMAA